MMIIALLLPLLLQQLPVSNPYLHYSGLYNGGLDCVMALKVCRSQVDCDTAYHVIPAVCHHDREYKQRACW